MKARLSCALVLLVILHASWVQACKVNGLQTDLLRKHLPEVRSLGPSSFLSAAAVRDILATAEAWYTHWAAAYLLAYADPSDPEVRTYLERHANWPPPNNFMTTGGAAWALFYQTIRARPIEEQRSLAIERLATSPFSWERALLAFTLSRFPRNRETGEALFAAINKEPVPKVTVELGFQLSQYTDMDLIERAAPILRSLRLPPYFMALRCDPQVMLNILTSGVAHSPRRSSAVGMFISDAVYDLLKQDQCPGTSPDQIANEAGCSIGQLCPPCGTWKNHGEFVSCVAQAANDFVAAGYIPAWQHGQIVSAAARSDVGKPHYDGAGCAEVDVDAHR